VDRWSVYIPKICLNNILKNLEVYFLFKKKSLEISVFIISLIYRHRHCCHNDYYSLFEKIENPSNFNSLINGEISYWKKNPSANSDDNDGDSDDGDDDCEYNIAL